MNQFGMSVATAYAGKAWAAVTMWRPSRRIIDAARTARRAHQLQVATTVVIFAQAREVLPRCMSLRFSIVREDYESSCESLVPLFVRGNNHTRFIRRQSSRKILYESSLDQLQRPVPSHRCPCCQSLFRSEKRKSSTNFPS